MRKLLLCAIASISLLSAGRYPFQNDILNIPDATDFAARIGACPGGMQGVLIAPRVIATVSHGGLNADVETQEPITIGGQNYTIIRKVEEGRLGNRDLTLCFLDRPVEGIDIQPVLRLDIGQTIPVNSLLHAISIVSNNIMLGRRFEPGAAMDIAANDVQHALPYGLNIPHYGILNSLILRENFDCLSVDNNRASPFHFIPIGGDSGSPCFASTNDNCLATVGIVSTIGANIGANAAYTYIGRHLDWIGEISQRHYAAENQADFLIRTVNALGCNFNAVPLDFENIRRRVEIAENDPYVKIRLFEQLQNQLPNLRAAVAADPENADKVLIVYHTEQTIMALQIPTYDAIENVLPGLRAAAAADPENADKAWIVDHRASQLNVLRPIVLEKLEEQLPHMIWARDNEENQTQERREYLQWIPGHLQARIAQLKISAYESIEAALPGLRAAAAADPENADKVLIVYHTEQTIMALQIPTYDAIENVLPGLRAAAAADPENADKAWIVDHRASQLNVLRPIVLKKLEEQLPHMIWARDNEENQTQERREYLQWIPGHLQARIAQLKISAYESIEAALPGLRAAAAADPENADKVLIVYHTEQTIMALQIPTYDAIENVLPGLRAAAAADPENADKAWIVDHRASQLNVLRPIVLEKLEEQLPHMIWARDNEANQNQERREYLQWIPGHLQARIAQLRY